MNEQEQLKRMTIAQLKEKIASTPCAVGKCYTDIRIEYAFRLWNGIGIPKDRREAFLYFKEAADFGHEVGLKWTAECYYNGEGISQDFEKSFKYFERLSRKHAWQQIGNLGMGKCCLQMKQPQKAFDYLYATSHDHRISTLVEEVQKEAQFLLGMLYYEGIGCEQDFAKAFDCFEKAACGNTPFLAAQYYLVMCYQEGKGTAVDIEMARFWALKCFEKNNGKIIEETKKLLGVVTK